VLLESATLLSGTGTGTGNGVATVALPWLILERTGSATAAGLVAAGTTLPLLLSSLFSGTVVDLVGLVGRRRVSLVSDLLSLAPSSRSRWSTRRAGRWSPWAPSSASATGRSGRW